MQIKSCCLQQESTSFGRSLSRFVLILPFLLSLSNLPVSLLLHYRTIARRLQRRVPEKGSFLMQLLKNAFHSIQQYDILNLPTIKKPM